MDEEVAKEFNRIVDLMVQRDAINEQIASLRKDIKEQFDIPSPIITKVVNIIRKDSLEQEQETWDTIKHYVETST